MNIILITGCPRSGTTAVGRVLAYAKGTATLHEPFSPVAGMVEVARTFEIPNVDLSTAELARRLSKIAHLRLQFHHGAFPSDGPIKRIARRFIAGRTQLSYYHCRLKPRLRNIIWKDPMASFSAAHLATAHGIPVIFCLRNPWAVAASFKRMRWGAAFGNLAERLPSLNLDLPPKGFDVTCATPAQKAAVLWNAIYRIAMDGATQSEHIYFLDMDSVLADPVRAYKTIYARLDLGFDRSIENKVKKTFEARARPAIPEPGKAHTKNRNLSLANEYWRALLSQEEIDFIEMLNGPLWNRVQKLAKKTLDQPTASRISQR